MSGGVFVFARLTTVNKARRDELLEKLQVVGEIARKNESGTLKYAALVPREEDSTTIYAIEEYVDKAAFDLHMSTIGVKAVNQWFADEEVLDPESKPVLHILEYVPDFRIVREEVQKHQDPHILVAELDYVPGGVETSIPYWKAVVETSRGEEGTLVYGILRDPQNENRLFAFEAYESPDYLKDVHVPSKAIQESIGNTKHLRTGLKHHALRKVNGFLYK